MTSSLYSFISTCNLTVGNKLSVTLYYFLSHLEVCWQTQNLNYVVKVCIYETLCPRYQISFQVFSPVFYHKYSIHMYSITLSLVTLLIIN